ncbi:MAG: sigma-70 family RNA polymerase sigma factor [Clostridia bacterium]|nr:sigma-70 family RNA polymerase sigma factor [Clostridia bacterium]
MTDRNWINDTTERHYKEIYCYCRRHVSTDDTAYELTQSVFLRLCENYRTIDRTSVRAWLYRVAKNVCADHYREAYRTKEWSTDMPVEDCADVFAQSDTNIADMEFADALSDLLSRLTDAERELFCDRYQRGISYEMLAEQRKMTPAAVRKRCSRIHKKLMKHIKLLFLIGQ